MPEICIRLQLPAIRQVEHAAATPRVVSKDRDIRNPVADVYGDTGYEKSKPLECPAIAGKSGSGKRSQRASEFKSSDDVGVLLESVLRLEEVRLFPIEQETHNVVYHRDL